MKEPNKLYWLEYSTLGGPLIITKPFEVVGFETKEDSWEPSYPDRLTERIFSDIEIYQPNVIVFFKSPEIRTEEPPEWITVCQRIRENPNLQHTRIIAILGRGEITPKQTAIWNQRYDFYTRLPFRVIELARVAKQFVGEQIKGFEGINYYLSSGRRPNGSWTVQSYLVNELVPKDDLQPDVKGQFARPPRTRLLVVDEQGKYNWKADSIQIETPTYLIYLVKSLPAWQNGLDSLDRKKLIRLAQQATSAHQLLIGVNETLLEIEPEIVVQILKQAEESGGWQLFINEHMWFEIVASDQDFRAVYEGGEPFFMI